jgi:hypothetical protein
MLSVADDLLINTWQHRYQRRKGRRAKVQCLPRFLGRIFCYFGQIILVPEETATDLIKHGPAALCMGADYWPQGWIIRPLEFSLRT